MHQITSATSQLPRIKKSLLNLLEPPLRKAGFMESGPPLDAARAEAPAMTVRNRINEEQSVRNSGFSREPRNQNCTSRKERTKILEAFQKNKETKSTILGRTENIISIRLRIVDSWIQFQTSRNPTHSQMLILSFL
jgi:hypothetical protein